MKFNRIILFSKASWWTGIRVSDQQRNIVADDSIYSRRRILLRTGSAYLVLRVCASQHGLRSNNMLARWTAL